MTNSKTRKRNPRGEGLRLRQEIVQAATKILNKGGSAESVSLRDIARQVGISAPSIYTHFADRDSILLAVVQEAFAELKTRLETVQGQTGLEADPTASLLAICNAYLEFALASPQRYRILFGGVWNAAEAQQAIGDEATGMGQDVLELVVQAIRRCVTAGQSSSTDPIADDSALWVALHGLAQLRTAAPLFPWSANIVETLVSRLVLLNPSA